jgi:hypothetical protein
MHLVMILLWNHNEYALYGRLRRMKDAIPAFCTEFPRREFLSSKATCFSRASLQSGTITFALIPLPPIPSSHRNELEPVERRNKWLRTQENTDE